MSPEVMGPEESAAVNARRGSAIALAAISILGTVYLALTPDDPFPPAQLRLNLATALLLIPMVTLRRVRASEYVAIAGLYLLAISSTFSTPMSDARLSASTMLFLTGMFGVTLLRGWLQWAWLAVVAFTWVLLVPHVPLVVHLQGAIVNLRWTTLMQLVVACIWLIRAWNRELTLIHTRDHMTVEAEGNALASAAARERTRVWRESLVRLHETVLNDIRYVLDAVDVDPQRLRRQIEGAAPVGPPRIPGGSLHDVIASLNAISGPGQRFVIGRLEHVRLTQQQVVALRAILTEVLRNTFRHSDASTIRLSADLGDAVLQISLRDDRSTTAHTAWSPGLGLGVVIRDMLHSIDADLTMERDGAVITVPMQAAEEPRASLPKSDLGRVIISSAAAGNALGGAAVFGALALSGGAIGVLTGCVALVGAVLSAYVTWRRMTVQPVLLIVAASIATVVPLLSRTLISGCTQAELPVTAATLSTMALGAVIVWAPSMRWWWLALGSFGSMLYLAPTALDACARSVVPGLIAASLTPVMMLTISVALHRTALHEARLIRIRRYAVAEEAAAVAARDFAEDLHSAVERARHLMLEIADEARVTDAQRGQLRCLDAEIRASIQVDPEVAGGMASAVRACILQASQAGVPVRVLTLRDSGDRRALPCEVIDIACALLIAAKDGSATAQILTSAEEDTLVITASRDAAASLGIANTWHSTAQDIKATLELGEDDEPSMLIVNRPAEHLAS